MEIVRICDMQQLQRSSHMNTIFGSAPLLPPHLPPYICEPNMFLSYLNQKLKPNNMMRMGAGQGENSSTRTLLPYFLFIVPMRTCFIRNIFHVSLHVSSPPHVSPLGENVRMVFGVAVSRRTPNSEHHSHAHRCIRHIAFHTRLW